MGLRIETVVVPPFMENSYIVGDEGSGKAILVDPGGEIEELAATLARLKLEPIAIVNTHAHIDHVAGVAEAKQRFKVPFWLHAGDRQWLENLPMQATMFGFARPATPEVERWLADGDEFAVGDATARVIHTPGHTPGGCCLFFPVQKVLLTGDTLFAGSIGRTDLPGGSMPEIKRSIRDRLFPLGDEVVFYPGHGPSAKLGHERRTNPFVGE